MRILSTAVLILLTFSAFVPASNPVLVKDYLSVPGPIELSQTKFSLSWSSHPSDIYYKQEYLSVGAKSETYTKMIMLETVVGDVSTADAAKSKIDELKERKKTDPVCNFQLIENKTTGEYLLDFVVSQATGPNSSIVEWNAYRYVSLKEKSGKKGLVLFGYSRRAYNAGTTAFLKSLKTTKQADINSVAAYAIPTLSIKE